MHRFLSFTTKKRPVSYRSPEKFCPFAALRNVVQNFSGKL